MAMLGGIVAMVSMSWLSSRDNFWTIQSLWLRIMMIRFWGLFWRPIWPSVWVLLCGDLLGM